MNSAFKIVPYLEVDGIKTATDSMIIDLFKKTKDDDLIKTVFYSGAIKSEYDFLVFAKSVSPFFYFLYDQNNVVGYSWLNRFENKSARVHFCFFKSFWGRSVSFGKHFIEKIFAVKNKNNEFIIDLLTGFIPVWNKKAENFALKCGAKTHGVIPKAIYNGFSCKSEDAVFFYYVKQDKNYGNISKQ